MVREDRDADKLRRANELGLAGRFEEAARLAREIDRPPADARALAVEAYAWRQLGRPRRASRAFAAAIRRDPSNWVLHRDWAAVLLQLGDRAQARDEMRRARMLNPRIRLPPGFIASGRPTG